MNAPRTWHPVKTSLLILVLFGTLAAYVWNKGSDVKDSIGSMAYSGFIDSCGLLTETARFETDLSGFERGESSFALLLRSFDSLASNTDNIARFFDTPNPEVAAMALSLKKIDRILIEGEAGARSKTAEIRRHFSEIASASADLNEWYEEEFRKRVEFASGAPAIHARLLFIAIVLMGFLAIGLNLVGIARSRAAGDLKDLNHSLEEEVRRRTDELSNAHRIIMESEKMSALGRIVAGVAHEVNTPLGNSLMGISYIADLIRNRETLDEVHFFRQLAEATESAQRNITTAADLMRSFKNIAVDQTRQDHRLFELGSCLDDIIRSLANRLRISRVRLESDWESGLYVRSDPGIFFQIISNLVENTILHGTSETGESLITLNAWAEEETCAIEYRDNGPGLTEDSLTGIFEPFYTTKPKSGGTGLGMSIVYNLVTRTLGGRISCPPTDNCGFLCLIWFPMILE